MVIMCLVIQIELGVQFSNNGKKAKKKKKKK